MLGYRVVNRKTGEACPMETVMNPDGKIIRTASGAILDPDKWRVDPAVATCYDTDKKIYVNDPVFFTRDGPGQEGVAQRQGVAVSGFGVLSYNDHTWRKRIIKTWPDLKEDKHFRFKNEYKVYRRCRAGYGMMQIDGGPHGLWKE